MRTTPCSLQTPFSVDMAAAVNFTHTILRRKLQISTAWRRGMGNGFPIGAIIIAPKFQAVYGMLGTTFGGNHLACAAAPRRYWKPSRPKN